MRILSIRIVALLIGATLQVLFGALVLYVPVGRVLLEGMTAGVGAVLSYAQDGITFMFGEIGTGKFGLVFAFQVLPAIIFLQVLHIGFIKLNLGRFDQLFKLLDTRNTYNRRMDFGLTQHPCQRNLRRLLPVFVRNFHDSLSDRKDMLTVVKGFRTIAVTARGTTGATATEATLIRPCENTPR